MKLSLIQGCTAGVFEAMDVNGMTADTHAGKMKKETISAYHSHSIVPGGFEVTS